MQRVVLGLNSVEDYIAHSPHFGAIAGRFANRIAMVGSRWMGEPTSWCEPGWEAYLHGGGPTGFGKQPWTIVHHDAASVTLVHLSPDGTNGFPGTDTCHLPVYARAGATLRIELWA